jgi:hypothetical protein
MTIVTLMSISKKIAIEDIRAENLDDLFDAGFVQFVVGEHGLRIEMTDAGMEVFLNQNDGPPYIRFKKSFWIYSAIAAVVAVLILFYFLK